MSSRILILPARHYQYQGSFAVQFLRANSRRRARREAREEAELAKHRAERPKLQQQFADLKCGLAVVTDAEWESIPDVGNLTRRKRRREERSFAVPDSIIVGDRAKGEHENSLDPRQQVCGTPVAGL